MSIQQLEDYIKEQEPIKEKKMEEAYKASDVWKFQSLSEKACEPIWRAGMQLRKIMPFVLKDHDKDGDLMTIEEFKKYCKSGGFIDYDGSGNYATAIQESNISIYPSDIEEGVYRNDFTHVVWYNR
jgi:hypothetical protein